MGVSKIKAPHQTASVDIQMVTTLMRSRFDDFEYNLWDPCPTPYPQTLYRMENGTPWMLCTNAKSGAVKKWQAYCQYGHNATNILWSDGYVQYL